ncbi:MAG: hypothetical protein JSV88_17005 [Candidatus Aminicenantes bacterium]|nr:MAG: hypothetical protein JSV88_17005 [Candidatus Aminicenantes bacterium]
MRTGAYQKIHNNAALKKIIFILGFLVFRLFFVSPQNLYCEETGFKYLKNYSYKDHYEHQAQNWGITQAKNGFIYVANNGGVLEFDGVSWRVIYVPNYTVRSLAIDESGTIYIGGKDEIGYLAPDAKGSLQYVSLLKYLDDNQKNFSNVWRTHATKEGIYFRTSTFLFRWNSGEIKVWKTDHLFRASFVCKGNFFVQQQKKGLMQLVNDSFKLIPGGETFAEEKIWMMVPYDNDKHSQKLLIGTRSKGFFLYDGKTAAPFPIEAADYLKENILYHGIRLSSGDFALATLHGGLVIMDSHGDLKYTLDKNSGLQDENIKYVFQDIQ